MFGRWHLLCCICWTTSLWMCCYLQYKYCRFRKRKEIKLIMMMMMMRLWLRLMRECWLCVYDLAWWTSRDAVQGDFVGDELKYGMASNRCVWMVIPRWSHIAHAFWDQVILHRLVQICFHPVEWNANDERKEAGLGWTYIKLNKNKHRLQLKHIIRN